MSREELFAALSGWLGILLAIFGVVWLVLWILVPFMIYFILHRLRRIHEDLYAKQVEANRLLAEAVRGQAEAKESASDAATRELFK